MEPINSNHDYTNGLPYQNNYHHERADGKGPFGIKEKEGPVEAELITIADSLDVAHHLSCTPNLGTLKRTKKLQKKAFFSDPLDFLSFLFRVFSGIISLWKVL
jgi:hypothetical protein